MEKYIEDKLKELCDENSKYFSKIMDIINNPNPKKKEYVEKHHIIPRSVDKSLIKDENNLISLSAYNHIMIHYYYYKCAKNNNNFKFSSRTMFFFVSEQNSSNQRLEALSEKEMMKIARLVEKVKSHKIKQSDNYRKNRKSSKPFICLETNKTFTNISYCMDEMKINNLNPVLNGKLLSANGYHFIWCDDKRLKTMSNKEIIQQIEDTIKQNRKEKRQHMFTDEWRDKISKAHNGKEFICLETNEIFTNQTECSKKHNINNTHLYDMLKKHDYYKTDKFHFIYVDEKGNRTNEECLNDIQKYILKTDGTLNRYNARQVICYETNIVYKSVSEAMKQTNIKGIHRCCLHIATCAGNYHWFYLDEDIDRDKYVKEHPIIFTYNRIICLETRKLYESANDVAKEFKCSRSLVTQNCIGKSSTCKDYHFLYERDYLSKTEDEIQAILNTNSKSSQQKMKQLYKEMISDGRWTKNNNGWNRFQIYYKENFTNREVI